MGIVRIKGYPDQELKFNLPKIIGNPIEIKIHIVRVYIDKEDETIISLLKLEIGSDKHFYLTVTNKNTHPAKKGNYIGYLIRRDDKGNNKKNHADSQDIKERIEKIGKSLKKFDDRILEKYQNGKANLNYRGHNGLRIFQKDMPAKMFKTKEGLDSWYRLKGGNRFLHIANYADEVIGCEGVGAFSGFDKYKERYGVMNSGFSTFDLLNNIIKVYEKNIKQKEQSVIQINIIVEKNIQKIKRGQNINPEKMYSKLYPNIKREKVKSIGNDLKPSGIHLTKKTQQ